LIESLRNDCRLVAIDQMGCGMSDRLARHPVRLSDRIIDLVEFIDRLDLRHVTLIAHDWGGAVGLGTALERPERFARCVLLNPGAFPPWYVPWQLLLLKLPLVGRVAIQGFNVFLRGALRTTVVHRERITRSVRRGYLAPHDSWAERRSIYEFVRDIPLSRRHPTWRTLAQIESRLGELAGRPFLFLWGMQDWCFRPACLDRFLLHFPKATVHRLCDTGHWVMEDAPDEVAQRVREFLGFPRLGEPLPAQDKP
jgi:haloalkane dehalogenase